jgi:hypothetical protein
MVDRKEATTPILNVLVTTLLASSGPIHITTIYEVRFCPVLIQALWLTHVPASSEQRCQC